MKCLERLWNGYLVEFIILNNKWVLPLVQIENLNMCNEKKYAK